MSLSGLQDKLAVQGLFLVDISHRGMQVSLRESPCHETTRGGPRQAVLRSRIGPMAGGGAAAVEQQRLHGGCELFDGAGGQFPRKLLQIDLLRQLCRSGRGLGGRGARRRFALPRCQVQPSFEPRYLGVFRFQLLSRHELFGGLRQELVGKAPIGQSQMAGHLSGRH